MDGQAKFLASYFSAATIRWAQNEKMWTNLLCGLILFVLCAKCKALKLELANDPSGPVEYPCDTVDLLKDSREISCMNPEEIWAFVVQKPERADRWQVVGGNLSIAVGQNVRHLHCLSPSSKTSKLTSVGDGTVFAVNDRDWEVTTKGSGEKLCLSGAIRNSYCRYDNVEDFTDLTEDCGDESRVLTPVDCQRFFPPLIDTGATGETCKLMQN